MRFSLLTFQGIVPRIAPRLLQDDQAQTAENCDLLSGSIKAVKEPLEEATLDATDLISLYLHNGSWLTWNTDVDVVKGPVFEDQYDRIYYTGDGVPKVRGTDSGDKIYDLGIPKPVNAPSVTATDKGAVTWTRTWRYQYESTSGVITQDGDLTEGSEVTETQAGKAYTSSIPAKVGAGANDVFVMYFDAYNANGTLLGRLYPDHSVYSLNSTFYLSGARASAAQVNAATATFTISYDTSRASDYEVDRAYVYSFVSGWGEEGPTSDASDVVAIDPTQDGSISNMDTAPPAGNYNITHKRIYRTVTTSAGEDYYLVAEIPIADATYLDQFFDSELGGIRTSLNWFPPESGLTGLVSMPGGILAGFVDNTVYFSEPNYPHAWPPGYAITVDYEIVGLGVTENSLVVCTKGFPYVITGTTPESMAVSQLEVFQSCVSKRSIKRVRDMVIYASPDGLVAAQGGVARLITEGYYRREQWQGLSPSSMIAAYHDDRYFAWASGGSLVFDFDEARSAVSTTDQTASGLYVDVETDKLYMIQSDKIVSWGTGATNMTLTWRSKEIHESRPMSPTAVRVVCDVYPVTIRFYADGTAHDDFTITDDRIRLIPRYRNEKAWSVEIEATGNVHELSVGQSIRELK